MRFDLKVILVVAALLCERVGVEGSKQKSLKEIRIPQCNIKSSTEALNRCINLSCISMLHLSFKCKLMVLYHSIIAVLITTCII